MMLIARQWSLIFYIDIHLLLFDKMYNPVLNSNH